MRTSSSGLLPSFQLRNSRKGPSNLIVVSSPAFHVVRPSPLSSGILANQAPLDRFITASFFFSFLLDPLRPHPSADLATLLRGSVKVSICLSLAPSSIYQVASPTTGCRATVPVKSSACHIPADHLGDPLERRNSTQ